MVETILQKVEAQRALIDKYLSGELAPDDDAFEEVAGADEKARGNQSPKLTNAQKKLKEAMKPIVDRAMAASQAEDEEQIEGIQREASEENKMLFASGPPGTGKTFVVHQQIRHWQDQGARILFVLPTGQLASDMRQKHPNIDVDTYHGGLWFHKDVSEALGIMTQYDLIILDEISMLTDAQFEKIVAMWSAADKIPCILLLGDFWQLPIVDRHAHRCE